MEKKQQQFSLWCFLTAFLLIQAIQNHLVAPHAETLVYSKFKALLRSGKIKNVMLGERVTSGTLKSGKAMDCCRKKSSRSSGPVARTRSTVSCDLKRADVEEGGTRRSSGTATP